MLWVVEDDDQGLSLQELHRKREEKRLENQRKAEEEIAMLKESGKVGRLRKNNVGKKVSKKTRAQVTGSDSGSDGKAEQRQPVTPGGRSEACNVDDFFGVRSSFLLFVCLSKATLNMYVSIGLGCVCVGF